jgi:hypothetical protein
MKNFILQPSTRNNKKFMIYSIELDKFVHFGSKGASDFTIHHDEERKNRYVLRHQDKEDWTANGMMSAGFWSKHLLWHKPSLEESIKDTEKRFEIRIYLV